MYSTPLVAFSENNVVANHQRPPTDGECRQRHRRRLAVGYWRVFLFLGAALTAPLFGGCADRGPERIVVSGTVTFNGKPLPTGWIIFVPLPNCPVPSTGAKIIDGKYRVAGNGGVPVGTFKIKIESYRDKPNAPKPDAPLPPVPDDVQAGVFLEQYIPKRYNVNTQLEITIPLGSGEITKNYELTE